MIIQIKKLEELMEGGRKRFTFFNLFNNIKIGGSTPPKEKHLDTLINEIKINMNDARGSINEIAELNEGVVMLNKDLLDKKNKLDQIKKQNAKKQKTKTRNQSTK